VPDYAGRPDPERSDLLARLIADPRPLVPQDLSGFSAATRDVVRTFRTIRELGEAGHGGRHPGLRDLGDEGPADLLRSSCS
jgi:phosphoenolpyruvate carboxylase